MFFRKIREELSELRERYGDVLKTNIDIINHDARVLNHIRNVIDFNRRLISKIDPDKLHVKIKYFDSGIEPIEKIAVGDWIDLRSAERVVLQKGEYYLLRLGVGMILPDGYEAHILPRSSTPSRFGIMCANSMGVIDNSYSGDADEWRFPAVAICDTIIEKGDRIAQFRIVKNQPAIEFEIVEHLNEKSRGGIGSTGER